MRDEFEVHCDPDGQGATLSGVLRLESPLAYKPLLGPLMEALERGPACFRLDLARLSFMNSSGITALSRLIIAARAHDTRLVAVVDDSVLWQRKTLSSLQRLNPRLEIERA